MSLKAEGPDNSHLFKRVLQCIWGGRDSGSHVLNIFPYILFLTLFYFFIKTQHHYSQDLPFYYVNIESAKFTNEDFR